MSNRYKGGIISATPPTTTGPYQNGTASGAWTLEQQMQLTAAGLWPTAGSVDPSFFIENLFSTYLYTGNGSTQTITNGIDITGKGGLVWIKNRTNGTTYHVLTDTARGAGLNLSSNVDIAQYNDGQPTFNSNGFNLINSNVDYNTSANNYVSWTFREQAKFFDIVTYTGDGSSSRNIAHNLGSTPGCIMVKRRDSSGNWKVTFNFIAQLCLNSTEAAGGTLSLQGGFVNSADSGSFELFSSGGSVAQVNASGGTYVAYLFAHNAGGFGVNGTDNVISCASTTTDGSGNATVNLGYEPQWVLIKQTNAGGQNWILQDNMRGMFASGNAGSMLYPNATNADTGAGGPVLLTSTGFRLNAYVTSSTIAYIAIRRGPMAVPTSANTVFEPALYTGNGATSRTFTSSTVSPIDSVISMQRGGDGNIWWIDRLRGDAVIRTFSTAAESSASVDVKFDIQNGYSNNENAVFYGWNVNAALNINYFFKRAPGFFDEVCYTGTGSATTFAHNLGVVPELMIVKSRSAGGENWNVYSATLTATKYLTLNLTNAEATDSLRWNDTAPTSSVFSLGTRATVNGSGTTFVNYLFATCAGVSKVGSYTGNGTTQTINCGFTTGARFVLIKATTDATEWFVFDTARGMTSGNDPVFFLNDTSAEINSYDLCDTTSVGFTIKYSGGLTGTNTNGVNYIFLAIA